MEDPKINHSSDHRITSISEPNAAPCDPGACWELRSLLREHPLQIFLQITFFTTDGLQHKARLAAEDALEPRRVERRLIGMGARLPRDKGSRRAFIEQIVENQPTVRTKLMNKPGFIDNAKGFVTPYSMFGSAIGVVIWDQEDEGAAVVPPGNSVAFKVGVLDPCMRSSFTMLPVAVFLGSSLPSYVQQKLEKELISETCIFHFVGGSTLGKTTLPLICLGCSSPPQVTSDYDGTLTGLEEEAYSRNDLGMALDDTEKAQISDDALFKLIRNISHRLASGRAKKRSSKAGYGNVTWSTFVLSTGSVSRSELAARHAAREEGDRVRFMDIMLPTAEEGGILGGQSAGEPRIENPAEYVKALTAALSQNWGQLVGPWIEYLLAADRSEEIFRLVEEFVQHVCPSGEGLDRRIAEKFAVPYAGLMLAIRANLIRCDEDWALKALASLYDNARKSLARKPDVVLRAAVKLAKAARKSSHYTYKGGMIKKPEMTAQTIAIRTGVGKSTARYLFEDCLDRIGIQAPIARKLLQHLQAEGIIKRSSNVTSSVQWRVIENGRIVKRRGHRFSRSRLLAYIAARQTAL